MSGTLIAVLDSMPPLTSLLTTLITATKPILLSVPLLFACGVSKAQQGLVNATGVHYQEAASSSVYEQRRCLGALTTGLDELASMGITNAHFEQGWACVLADLDGNGFVDLAIPGPRFQTVVDGVIQTDIVRVLLFKKGGLFQVSDLPRPLSDLLIYSRREKQGEFGEPASARDGLVQWGEGGKTFVFLFEAGEFRMSEVSSEHD